MPGFSFAQGRFLGLLPGLRPVFPRFFNAGERLVASLFTKRSALQHSKPLDSYLDPFTEPFVKPEVDPIRAILRAEGPTQRAIAAYDAFPPQSAHSHEHQDQAPVTLLHPLPDSPAPQELSKKQEEMAPLQVDANPWNLHSDFIFHVLCQIDRLGLARPRVQQEEEVMQAHLQPIPALHP